MSPKRPMFAVLFLAAVFLAGCTNEPDTYQGKTAKQWAEEAQKPPTPAQAAPKPDPAEVQRAQQAAAKQAEEAEALRREEATRTYVQKFQDRLITVKESKDGKELVTAAQTALEREISGGDDLVLLGSLYGPRGAFVNALLPKRGETAEDARLVSAEAVASAEKAMRAEVFAWFARDPKRVDAVWPFIRPKLRAQYGVLLTLRGHEQLFKTSYTSASFEPLRECLVWNEELTFGRREGEAEQPHPEKKRCDAIFKKFGVKAEFGVTGDQRAEYAARNALYIVRLLARRALDGGEKFAQHTQRLALDAVKP